MKIVCSIFLLVFLAVDTCFSQDSTAGVIYINKIPPAGILLDKGWKFHAGDNPDYEQPGFDDSKWQSINPTLDIRDSLPQVLKSGICWFRLHLSFDTDLLKNQLALAIIQSGASEIYLNGQLIRKFGVVSTNPKEIKAYDPFDKPVFFTVNREDKFQILSIRFARQPNMLYTHTRGRGNPALQIRINDLETSIDYYQHEYTGWAASVIFRIGAFFILTILHLAFYLFYPSKKANLYFCLSALFMCLSELAVTTPPHELERLFYQNNLAADFLQIRDFFLLTAIYSLLEQQRGWIYKLLLALTTASIFLNIWPYYWGWAINAFIISNLIYIEIVRISFLSVKNKKRGAWIVATGSICFSVFWVSFVLGISFNYLHTHISPTYMIGDLIFNLAFLSIPVATSIYLGLDFAFGNISLKQKLIEIEKLSEDNLKKETEKNAMALQMAALETKALRSQMNPHFIFNALNAIKKFLLKNDTVNADKYLSSFAKLQRLVLDNTRESKVVLENEVKLLELYLRLEHLRFEDRLIYGVHVDEKINLRETEIPSMLIQPCIENSIVHGLQHKEGKGEIKISFCQKDGWIEAIIEDDGIGRVQAAAFRKNEVIPHKSLATTISEERLLALRKNKNTPAGIEIIDLKNEQGEGCGTKVIICIPVE